MAYFHCLIGGGSSGGGYTLTVTCDAAFAGTTITCTDGVTTLTSTCPSVSPYEVEFEIPNGGTWTVSGIASGSTCTASIDIPDELELIAIPDGSTVTPTDVIQTWLKCGGIFDKSYTTLNEVLADSTTLLALISDNNAVDYLVRSTTFASDICADSTAMTDIGANNYCANTLLADSTWLTAICNSTYFESVLNVKVPTMTSNTAPSGECVSIGSASGSHPNWHAFDNSTSTWYAPNPSNNAWIGYKFTSQVICKKASITLYSGASTITIQGSNDLSSWTNIESSISASNTKLDVVLNNSTDYLAYRILATGTLQYVTELQFYGRADV